MIGVAGEARAGIYRAPVILAKVLVDGVLFFGIARRVNRMDSQHWVTGVMRRTIVPMLVVVICYSAIGIGLQAIAPQATTMAEAVHAKHQR